MELNACCLDECINNRMYVNVIDLIYLHNNLISQWTFMLYTIAIVKLDIYIYTYDSYLTGQTAGPKLETG